ncbi:hypothetical protein ELH27_12875 [Rhizobium leguminosarum]|uniref:Uncharacterized protein n=1 Tax=Rhizobium beringeri TaxID=3019934 RepID=A0ABY1XVX6_9HYPH|nr:hypothetical protein ELH27_12875 [Rhizobium leguminosarum]TBD05384.1 hypothetical protein ELH21_13740 [Rhizobium leguminosarum]TBE71552.1 hypothetical protein ELH03_12755 [Rhizobium beringeri]
MPNCDLDALAAKDASGVGDNLALYSTSSSALCLAFAAPTADARDKPEHDERGVGRLKDARVRRYPTECHFTGMTTGASVFFSSTTMNFAGLDLLALRLTR